MASRNGGGSFLSAWRFGAWDKGLRKLSVAACLWQAFGGSNRVSQASLQSTIKPTAFPQKYLQGNRLLPNRPLSLVEIPPGHCPARIQY